MRKLLIIAALMLVLAGGALLYLWFMKPAQRAPSTETIALTPERIERGRYLTEAVLSCWDCHSERDENRFAMPVIAESKGAGMRCQDRALGFPGKICSPNITPDRKTGIGDWTDGELMRAIREGVDKYGNAIFPLMPYHYYRALSDEDARSVVAYLKTTKAIEKSREETELDFPVNIAIKFEPKPLTGPVRDPDPSNVLNRGKYLAEIAGCRGCHSPVDQQRHMIPGKDFSGGQEFPLDVGVSVTSSNITPDPKTGIGKLSREEFVGRFKSFENTQEAAVEVPVDRNTVMPWLNYAQMTVEDLSAIYDYLQTVPPIVNQVKRMRPRKG